MQISYANLNFVHFFDFTYELANKNTIFQNGVDVKIPISREKELIKPNTLTGFNIFFSQVRPECKYLISSKFCKSKLH